MKVTNEDKETSCFVRQKQRGTVLAAAARNFPLLTDPVGLNKMYSYLHWNTFMTQNGWAVQQAKTVNINHSSNFKHVKVT